MMEKAIKQRLLGGLVLVAGAALFLPVLLDGSGAALTIPPMPPAPEVAGVEGMAPRLDQKVAEAGAEVAAAHEGRDATPAATDAAGEAADVAPDAAALAAEQAPAPATAPAAGAGAGAAAALAPAKPTVALAPAARVPAPAPAATVPAAKAPATGTVAPAVAKPEPRPVARVEPKPEPKPELKAEPKPVAKAGPAAEKAAAGAWMVQVARVSSREKAQELMRKLRGKGYQAVLSQQGDSWKVMVGPELSREVATSTKNRLNADGDIGVHDAWVQAYKP